MGSVHPFYNHRTLFQSLIKIFQLLFYSDSSHTSSASFKPTSRSYEKNRSYKGKVGKIAPNLLNNKVQAEKLNEKLVTEFKLLGEKL